jgi:hypothetical protein
MLRKPSLLMFVIVFSLMTPLISYSGAESTTYDIPNGTVIDAGSELVLELGSVPEGWWVVVSHDSDENPIDITVMTKSNWETYTPSTALTNGTELSTTFSIFRWQIDQSDDYVVIFDNSERFDGGADGLVAATLDKGYGDDGASARVTDYASYDYHDRLYVQPSELFRYDFGQVGPGSYLHMNVDVEDWFSGGVDGFLVEGNNIDSFLNGDDTWNRNASFFDISINNWYFEPDYLASWSIFIENGPRGESNQMVEAAVVDVHFDVDAMDDFDIIKTSRMVESGEAWHGELGLRGAGTVLDFSLDLEGFTSEIDILILNTTEALRYLEGENVSVLGHASLINTDSWDSWSYTFSEQNTYSILLDNTDSPIGGGAETRPIHAEITVNEATLSSNWLGWTKSRHYIEDDSYLTFDLGELFTGDELYYRISGKHFGSGFMQGFDVALMTNDEYSKMVAGETPAIIEGGSDIDTWFGSLSSYEVETDGDYVLVIEIGDKIAGGSSDDGAWMMDFTVKSLGSVTLEQAMDENYWLTATHHTQVPEGTTTIDDQDGQRNIGNTQAEDDSGGGAGGLLAVCCGLPVLLLVVRRRRKKSAAQQIQVAIEDGIESALSAQQQPETSAPTTPPPVVDSKHVPDRDLSGIVGNDGYEWIEFPESSGNHFYRVPGAGSWETWDN